MALLQMALVVGREVHDHHEAMPLYSETRAKKLRSAPRAPTEAPIPLQHGGR
jgi:hypothetical protein